jgi:hypothetical protein
MLRRVVAAVVMLFLFVSVILAAEVKGTITKVEAGNKSSTITIKVDDKEQKVRVGRNTKILNKEGEEIKDGVKGLNEGDEVTVTTEEVEKNGKKRTTTKEIKVTKPKG